MQDFHGQDRRQWYTRRGGEVQGPFPSASIVHDLVVGRLRFADELSADGQVWAPAVQMADLIGEIRRAQIDDPVARQRLMAERRWEEGLAPAPRRAAAHSERRERFLPRTGAAAHSELEAHARAQRRNRLWSGLIAGGVLAALTAIVVFYRPQPAPQAAACGARPAPGVDWNNCNMDGAALKGASLIGAQMQNMKLSGADLSDSQLVHANLSYTVLSTARLTGADLRSAVMVGVNLKRADLTGGNLAGADLSYADLSGAHLDGAELAAARLDHAVWQDGRVCAAGSVGRCN